MDVKILLVEDDPALRETITCFLEAKSENTWAVISASDGDIGMQEILTHSYNVILLDIMLPGKDGFALCAEARKRTDAPVMFLTARAMEEDKLTGYDLGCDDYLVKPFSLAELFVRIKALLRRSEGAAESKRLCCGPVTLNKTTGQVILNGASLDLPRREYQLLQYLLEHKNALLTRDQLLDAVWGQDFEGTDRAVDNQIRKLRKDLGPAGKCIKAVIGMGYRLEEPK